MEAGAYKMRLPQEQDPVQAEKIRKKNVLQPGVGRVIYFPQDRFAGQRHRQTGRVIEKHAVAIEINPPPIQEAYADIILGIDRIFTDQQNDTKISYTPKMDKLDEKNRQTVQQRYPVASLTLIEDDGKKIEFTIKKNIANVDGPRDEIVRTIVLYDDSNPFHLEKRTLILTTPAQALANNTTTKITTVGLLYLTKLDENLRPITEQIPITDPAQCKMFTQALQRN